MTNKLIFTVVRMVVGLVMLWVPLSAARSQSSRASVAILDQGGNAIAKLTDGGIIRVRFEFNLQGSTGYTG